MRPNVMLFIGLAAMGALAALDRDASGQADPRPATLRPIDDAQLRAAGIRKLTSRHLTLYTDLPSDAEVDHLPAVFDQAVPQWAAYFGVDQRGAADVEQGATGSASVSSKLRDWHARAFLIKDRRPFEALGLMPPPGPDRFQNGISIGAQLWLYEQPTVYYRRHLLLHEGTHAFMVSFLGGCGPGWFMEGTAELMATHRLDDAGRLTLRIMPEARDEVPMLGRIKLVRDAVAAGKTLDLAGVMQIDNRKLLENEAYAWSWAATKFFDSHPRYRQRFRSLKRHVRDRHFNDVVRRVYAADWDDLDTEWAAFVATLDHGYDFERMVIEFRSGVPLSRERQTVTIRADRGWQSTDVWLEAGRAYQVTASGRFQIAEEIAADGGRQPWPCEPGGVTIEYYDGQPLGMLLGAIHPKAEMTTFSRDAERSEKQQQPSFPHPLPIGLGTTIQPTTSGTLYLRVNDSAGRLDDNRGALTVAIEAK